MRGLIWKKNTLKEVLFGIIDVIGSLFAASDDVSRVVGDGTETSEFCVDRDAVQDGAVGLPYV